MTVRRIQRGPLRRLRPGEEVCPDCDGERVVEADADDLFDGSVELPCSGCGGTGIVGEPGRRAGKRDPKWPDQVRAVSFGGGVQSMGNMVLSARGLLHDGVMPNVTTFLFANTGDDSEDPGTLIYVREIARPFADAHGLELHELVRVRRDKRVETLYAELMKPGSRRLPIPVRMDNGAPGTRSCTADFKIKIIARWFRAHGADPDHKAIVAVGISLDEIARVNARRAAEYETIYYPLIGQLGGDPCDPAGGRRWRRDDIEVLIRSEPLPGGPDGPLATRLRTIINTPPVCGYGETHQGGGLNPDCRREDCLGVLPPVTVHDLTESGFTMMPRPPKSACWFCPFKRPYRWMQMRSDEPQLFARACDLEATLNARRATLGKDQVWLTRFAAPLGQVIADMGTLDAAELDGDDAAAGTCDNGTCMT